MATKFEKIISDLEYAVRCHTATVVLGTKGIFGSTYEDAVKAQIEIDNYKEAIRILKENDA